VAAAYCLVLPFVQQGDLHAAEISRLAPMFFAVTAASLVVDSQRNMLAAVLRPFHDTRFAMWNGLIALWLIALPAGYLFAFMLNMGPAGLRYGTLTRVVVGLALHAGHHARTREFRLAANATMTAVDARLQA
jgi:MATE family multidrug resistance protein